MSTQVRTIPCSALLMILLALMLFATKSWATTYYVDYTNGADTNAGTTKAAPWKNAPGMYTASGLVASTTIHPGDSIILKGCVIWPNAVFPWQPIFSGSNGNPIYIGVDKRWWDSTVSGCSTAWNRPIMNPGGATTDPASSGVEILMDNRLASYITWDNFEVINWYTYPDTSSGSNEAIVWHVSSAGHGASYNTIENMYVHHWINPYISIGTGNITSGSCVITNYVPYSYSPSPASSWVSVPGGMSMQALPQGAAIPEGNNSPVITAISGSNPYSITFTNTTGCPTRNYTGAVIQIGVDAGVIIAGNSAGDTGTVVQNNVFDGSDTAEAQWNPPVSDPAYDCTSNSQACMASVEVGRQGPQIWRNNVMRYVSNGFIGSSSEMSGNLLEYFRLGTNPTGHTNVWEDQPCLGNTCLYYNNVIRHMNWVTATGIPGGAGNIGVPLMVAPYSSSSTSYVFNNVLYDMTQNTVVEINTSVGTVDLWNNTIEGGPDSGASYPIFGCSVPTCTVENNLAITTNANPWGACGSGCTHKTNQTMTPTAAPSSYYTNQTPNFSPNANAPTAGGTNAQSLCLLLQNISSAAYTACQRDTSYAVHYCQTNHTATGAMRRLIQRPASPTAWSVGAYQGTSGPMPPCQSNATVTVPQ